MAAADAGMLLGLGIWLELRGDRRRRSPWRWARAHRPRRPRALARPPGYRGSSGLASALFVLAALEIARHPPPAPAPPRLPPRPPPLGGQVRLGSDHPGHPLFAAPCPLGSRSSPWRTFWAARRGCWRLQSQQAPQSGLLAVSRLAILITILTSLLAFFVLLVVGALKMGTSVLVFATDADLSALPVKALLLALIEVADLFLLATVFYLITVGLYELFSRGQDGRPPRLDGDGGTWTTSRPSSAR